MSDNIEIFNNDRGSVVVECESSERNVITFGGAGTLKAGTILARSTSTGAFIVFAKGGSSDGNGAPKGVLTYDVTAEGASDVPAQVLTAGIVNSERLIIDADGDGSNVDSVVLDLLRAVSIRTKQVVQLDRFDNPQPEDSDS